MKKVIFLAAAVFCLAACSTEDDTMTQYNDNVVRIGSATVVGAVQTRVNSFGNGDSFEDGDEILLVNESRNDLNEDVYVYNQLAWTAKGDGVYWKIGGENNFKAYYPADQDFWAIQDQSTVEKLSLADWMEASVSAKKGNDISLSFSHQRAKVIINCNFSGYEGKTVTMTEPQIYNGFSITPYCSNNQLIAILRPKSEIRYSDSDKFIELKVNGLTYKVYANDFLKTTGLEKGKVYTFNLTITNKEMTISTVDVKDWTGNALEEVQATAAIVDASNHSIRTYEQNQLNNDLVRKAFGEGTELSIVGPMGNTDFLVLKNYLNSLDENSRISLDLSDANVTEIPEEAFKSVKTIKTIKLPKTVRTIKRCAFYLCQNLNVLNLSELNSLEEIGIGGFTSIALTDEVILPSSITTIGEEAFRTCQAKSITIPEHVTNIAPGLFIWSSLENIIIKGNLTSPDGSVALGSSCFAYCKNLKSIDLSACTTVPTTDANNLPVVFNDSRGNTDFTVYVKDETMKTKFEADEFFKNFTISVKE